MSSGCDMKIQTWPEQLLTNTPHPKTSSKHNEIEKNELEKPARRHEVNYKYNVTDNVATGCLAKVTKLF